MTPFHLLKVVVLVLQVLFGVASLIAPRSIGASVNLVPKDWIGMTELRASFGGAYVAVAIAALVLDTPEVYTVVGALYLGPLIVRVAASLLDRNYITRTTFGVMASEALFAIILMMPLS